MSLKWVETKQSNVDINVIIIVVTIERWYVIKIIEYDYIINYLLMRKIRVANSNHYE